MRELLRDVLLHTHEIGDFEAFKIVIDQEGVGEIKSSSKDFSVTLTADLKNNVSHFAVGNEERKMVIGFTRLNVLYGYLSVPIFYEDGASLECGYMDNGTPREIILTTKEGHRCTYRLMQPEIARRKIRTFSMTGEMSDDDFEIVFQPSETFMGEFFKFSSILSKFNNTFSFMVEDHMLYTIFGEDDKVKIPVCKTDIETMQPINYWPIKQVLGILRKANDPESVKIYISNKNSLLDIKLDTDHALYSYKLTATT